MGYTFLHGKFRPMNSPLEKQRFYAVTLLVLWCVTLTTLSNSLAGTPWAFGLLWNLFLALVPTFWSAVFQAASARNLRCLACFSFGIWLLFLPNAPYLLTDLIHLGYRTSVPLWCRLAMLLSFAGTGTVLGYLSLINVQEVIEARFGKFAGWCLAVGALMASGYGIYLGRFLRWNSWDALTMPRTFIKTVLDQFIDPGPYPHPIPVTLVFGIGLIIGYLALRVLAVPASNRLELLGE